MAGDGAGDADHTARETIDAESGELLVVKGAVASGNYEIVGSLIQSVFIRGREGHEAKVSSAGELRIRQATGLPFYMIDAAANADDSYFDLGTAPRACSFCSIYVETNDAIISFNGGVTDHFFLDKDAGQVLLQGLDIPAGATISGKNAVAAADYTNLRIAVW